MVVSVEGNCGDCSFLQLENAELAITSSPSGSVTSVSSWL